MKLKNRRPLRLEALESRWVPATVRFYDGTLYISNPHITAGATTLTVTQMTVADTFQVKDSGDNNGIYGGVSNIYITGSNAADAVTIDLASFSYGGSLNVIASYGNDTINLLGAGGQVTGNVNIQLGTGKDAVNINRFTATGAAATGALTVAGNTQVNAQGEGNDTLTTGNGTSPTTFLGNVSVTGVPNDFFTFGQPDTFRGNLTVNSGANPNPLFVTVSGFDNPPDDTIGKAPASAINIYGNFEVNGGPGNDLVVTGFLNVRGNMYMYLGGGDDSIGNDLSVSDQVSGITTVYGNLLYNSTAGVDIVDLAGGQFLGNVTVHMGQGGPTPVFLGFGDGPSGVALDTLFAPTYIAGNLQETGGNGDFSSTPFGGPGSPLGDPDLGNDIQATILGSATFQFGNGTNSIGFAPGSSVGGPLTYYAGNGNNSFSVAGSQLYNLNVNMGNGNNTFTANPPYNPNPTPSSVILSGNVISGTGTNTFNQNGATIEGPWYLSGF